MDLQLVMLVCFIAITAACTAVFLVLRDVFVPNRRAMAGVSGSGGGGRRLRRSANVFDEYDAAGFTARLDQSFDRLVLESGFEVTPATVFLMLLACGLALGGTLLVYYDNPLAGIMGFAVGMALPLMYLMYHRYKRMRAILDQLPAVLDLLSRGVRAGQSVDQAIELVGREMKGPLPKEFSKCARHLELGMSVAGAAQSLARRVRLVEMRMLASALSVHRQSGGNLPATLERMSAVIRDRLNYRRQMRASTGAGRSSTFLISIIAPLLYIAMFIWQPDHVQVLVDHSIGRMLLLGAIALEIVGIIWVARLLQSEY